MTEFGNYVVIIKNEQEFIRRLDRTVESIAYLFLRKDVFYYSESIEDDMEAMQLLSLGKDNFAFLKKETDFSFQKEYRYLVMDAAQNGEKWLKIKIGDLSNIAEIQLSDTVIETYM